MFFVDALSSYCRAGGNGRDGGVLEGERPESPVQDREELHLALGADEVHVGCDDRGSSRHQGLGEVS